MRIVNKICFISIAIAASILLAANITFAKTGESFNIPIDASYTFGGNTYSVDSILIEGVDVKSFQETSSKEREKEIEVLLSDDTGDDCRFNLSFRTTTVDPSKAPLILDKTLEEYSRVAQVWGGILGYSSAMTDTKHGNIANGTKKVRLREGYGEVSIYSYLYPNDEAFYPSVVHLVFRKEGKLPCAITSCALLGDGQWMNQKDLYGAESCGRLVVPYSEIEPLFSFEKEGPCDVYIDGNKVADMDLTQWESALSASNEGDTHIIELRINETAIRSYSVVCYKAQYSGMPDKVVDYICPFSQYTNNGTPANVPYGNMYRAVGSLRGGNFDAAGADLYTSPPSIGNLGGYITYYYEDAIWDDPANPYGIEFIINGNAVSGNSSFAEPGNVSVSEDGKTWYKLAGSIHYDDVVHWNQKVIYRKGENETTLVQVGDEEELSSAIRFPRASIYPLYQWETAEKDRITLTTDRITPQAESNEYGNTIPTYPAFGYADCGLRDTTNQASNPYAGLKTWGESGRVDGFDLAWAVDDDGNPVELTNGIHYIKIATATMIDGGAIGEKSTEVNMVRRAAPDEKHVGTTTAPSSIEIDGRKISGKDLRPFEMLDADVEGIFDIRVNAMKNANVYINSLRSNTAFLEKADHGIVRVIVQEGKKAPLIYYFRINQSSQPEGRGVSEVLLKSQGTYLKPERKEMVCYYDEDTLVHQADENGEIPFPEPVWEDTNEVSWHFLGFSDEEGKTYTGYSTEFAADHAGKVTLTENTEREDLVDVPDIIVSFRLVGSTVSKTGVDLSQGQMDTEYQTWYATREYEVPYGSTVYDVFCKALDQAGLEAVGASANYVSTIVAPKALGGYRLSEMTNGPYSGWMYTLNGEHTDGMKDTKLADGDEIIWHYVNDYRYEVADWEHLGGSSFPQLGTDESLMNLWVSAEDKDPVESASEEKPGDQTENQPDGPAVKPQTKQSTVKAPARAKIKKVKPSKKALTVKWKKVKNATGYRVQIARDKKFKKARKTKKVRKYPSKGLTFRKLKSKKKYFVRVQAFRIVKGKTIYGKWSAVKAVRVK